MHAATPIFPPRPTLYMVDRADDPEDRAKNSVVNIHAGILRIS